MNPLPPPAGDATTTATGGIEFRIPLVSGDPGGIRRLADGYDRLADDVAAAAGDAVAVLQELGTSWIGRAATAATGPADQFERSAASTVTALRRAAGELVDYAARVARAEEHHGWSLGRLLTLGATVVVTAGAVVATMGAAAAVAGAADAALAADAVDAAGAAAAAAETAGAEAGASLGTCARALAEVHAMGGFLLPHLAAGELDAGMTAALQELRGGQVRWGDVLGAGAAGLAASATVDQWTADLAPVVSGAPIAVRRAAPHLLQSGVWGAAGAGQDVFDGRPVSVTDVVSGALTGGSSSVGRQVWRDARAAAAAAPEARAARIAVRLLAGHPDLDVHERYGGHVLARHGGPQARPELRVTGRGGPAFASVFHDRAVADSAIGQVLLDNREVVQRWLAGGGERLLITGRFRDGSAGLVWHRGSPVGTTVERVLVVLDRPGGVPRIKTAYPVFTRSPALPPYNRR